MKSVFVDIVSDIVCPWCAVGYHRLKRAADNLGVNLAINWHPFKLNPNMSSEGEDLYDHFHKKYGMTTEKTDALGDALKRYGALLDFEFNYPQGNRMRNTFRAHQLLAWARTFGAGTRAYEALFTAYFSDQRDIGATEVLLDIVDALNLDRDAAEAILSRGVLAESVKENERRWQGQGIHAVPAVIFPGRRLVSGAQPVEHHEQHIRQALTGELGELV